MKNLTLVLAFFAVASAVSPGSRDSSKAFYSGNEALPNCQELDNNKSDFDGGRCAGLMDGTAKTLELWQEYGKVPEQFLSCRPEEVTNGQKLKVFIKYMNDHPERLHEEASRLFLAAMHQAFPCSH